MTNDLDPWFKLLSSIASLGFAALAVFGSHSVEYLLAAILVYQWGRSE